LIKRIRKISSWVAVIFICIGIASLITGLLLPIEFINYKAATIVSRLYFSILIISAFSALSITYQQKYGWGTMISIMVVLSITIFITFYLIAIASLSNMCSWTTVNTLYENTENPSVKIVEREFGCGATDSSNPTKRLFKTKQVTPFFVWVTEFDTASVDKTKWHREVIRE
jgi:hypothetical protein